MPKWFFSRINIIYFLFAAALTVSFYSFSTFCYVADSEIWLLTLSQNILHVRDIITIYYKWTFHFLIFLFSHWAPTETAVYDWARMGTSTIAVLSVLITTHLFTKIFNNRKMFFPLFFFLLSSSLFFNQGFRIRADIYTYFFHALIVWFLYSRLNKNISWKDHAITLFLNGLIITTSPKMIYFFISQFFLSLLLVRLSDKHKKKYFWLAWQSHLLCLSLITFACFITFFIHQLPNVPYILSLAAEFYFKKFAPVIFTPEPWSSDAFWYMSNYLFSNLLHSLALFATLIIIALRYLGLTPAVLSTPQLGNREVQLQNAFGLYAVLMMFCTIIHNDRLPFFLAPMFLPITAYSFLFCVSEFEKLKKPYLNTIMIVVLCILSYRAFAQYIDHAKMNTNFYQKLAIKDLERYKASHPGTRIYDIIGILPRKTDIFAFIGPGEENLKQNLVAQLNSDRPDIVLYVFKMYLLEPQMTDYLMQNMIPIEKSVWARGFSINIQRNLPLFQKLWKYQNKIYWVFPNPKYKHVYDLTNQTLITSQTFPLDDNLKLTKQDAKYIAVPQEYLSLGFSDYEPINFLFPPEKLFRYDTGY